MTKTGNCTLCGRGNCLANDKAKSKVKQLNSLAPIATNNILKALRIAADHSVDEMIDGSEPYELFSNYVRKACDAIHTMNNIDCRLLSTIFGLQSKARYFGKSAGSVRNSLSHVDMDQPDPHVLYLAVTIHFPIWYVRQHLLRYAFCAFNTEETYEGAGIQVSSELLSTTFT